MVLNAWFYNTLRRDVIFKVQHWNGHEEFENVQIVRLIVFITAGCLETISNVAYNISDPSND